ncbi:hypothetical protein NK214_06445 [Chromobacterium sp. S0633]|uniref:hypothetical protein n=1 Tax=Chromobacterium sp. S0633 TaxID=2957805 RepID=UPI00209E67E7|nr:hypothetical protein [Chromobacterium sp. S0633]MCP1289828.1 hypothetical protein [Chromobacterium sp. S0633]
MIAVKVIKPFKYSPDGIKVVEVEKGKADLPEDFIETAVAEGWIEPPKKSGAGKGSGGADDKSGAGGDQSENDPPKDPPAD